MNDPDGRSRGVAGALRRLHVRHTGFELLLELLKPALVVVLTMDALQRTRWPTLAPGVGQGEALVAGYLVLSQVMFWLDRPLKRWLFPLSLLEALVISLIYGLSDEFVALRILIYPAAAGMGARLSAERAGICATVIWALTTLPPLLLGEAPLGVSAITGALPSGAGLLLMALLGHHLIAADRSRARHQAEVVAVHEMTRAVSASLDPGVVSRTVAQQMSRIFEGAACLLAFADEEAAYLAFDQVYPPPPAAPPARLPLAAAGLLARVFAGERPESTTLVRGDPSLDWLASVGRDPTALAAPLMLKQHRRGVIAVVAPDGQPFDGHHVRLLETAAAHAATAMDHARLYASAERETVLLSRLYEFSRSLSATHGFKHRLHVLVEMSKRLVGGESAVVLAPEGGGRVFAPVDFSGSAAAELSELRLERDDPILAPVLDDGKPVVAPLGLALPQGEWKSYAVVPLSRHRHLAGVLLVAKPQGQWFTTSDLQLLFMVSQHATLSLDNARRFEDAQRLATSDGLTGLANHRHFQERLRQEVARSDRHGCPLALIMMDVDYFKRLNDTEGHPRGDALLRAIARILGECARQSDVLARYGGDEFAVVAVEATAEQAAALARRIRADVAALREIGGVPLQAPITLSLGIAGYPEHAASASDLVDRADQALAAAKQAGRNRVAITGAQAESPGPDGSGRSRAGRLVGT